MSNTVVFHNVVWVRVTQSLVLCVCLVDVVCTFSLAIVLSVLRYTDYDYTFWYLQALHTRC